MCEKQYFCLFWNFVLLVLFDACQFLYKKSYMEVVFPSSSGHSWFYYSPLCYLPSAISFLSEKSQVIYLFLIWTWLLMLKRMIRMYACKTIFRYKNLKTNIWRRYYIRSNMLLEICHFFHYLCLLFLFNYLYCLNLLAIKL